MALRPAPRPRRPLRRVFHPAGTGLVVGRIPKPFADLLQVRVDHRCLGVVGPKAAELAKMLSGAGGGSWNATCTWNRISVMATVALGHLEHSLPVPGSLKSAAVWHFRGF